MENGFELLDPSNARAFLKRFNAEGRRKGNSCYQRGCVTLLEVDEPGESYNAKVQEQENDYEVGLYYDGSEGWMGECSCSPDDLCHHQYAAMKALLAEHGATVVRNLSSGKSTTPQSIARAREVDPGIARKLTAVLRRPLSGTEAKFVKGIENAYTKCRQTGNITYWDFEEMGLRLKGYGWDAVKIWPAFPANEHEFWLYIAHAAKQHNVPIPEFMRFITDFEPIE